MASSALATWAGVASIAAWRRSLNRAAPIAIVAACFPEWGIYSRDYQIADVPAEQLTHLIYAFAQIDSTGRVALFDGYAATDKRFSDPRDAVGGVADRYDYPAGDAQANQTVFGNFNQISELKQLHPNLRTNIAIGGWTLSGNFSTSLDSAAERSLFTDSVISFLKTYPMFDGVDFDWEYPGGGGLAGNSASPADGPNYTATLKLLREKLNSLGQESGRTYEISVASPAGIDKIPGMNLGDLAQSVDFFNLMAYDFHGTWEGTTGHQAALTGDAIGYDISTAVNAYLAAGVDPGKIVIGSPMYSRAWKGVQSSPDDYGVADYGYKDASAGAALLVGPAPAPTPIPAPIPTPIPTPGTADSSTSSPSGSSSDPIIGGGSGGTTTGFGGSTSGGITGVPLSGSGSGAQTPADPLTNPMGAQVISVASGVTRLVASESLAETFKLSYAWGRQLTIEGFDSRHDQIDLRGFWGEATGAHAVASPAGALIELGFNAQQVLLAGVEASQLGSNGNLIV